MNNKEFYKETMDEIHIPKAVLEKVRDMEMKQIAIKRESRLRYVVIIMAALVICFAVSNGISYAATGDTWIGKITMYVNGEEVEKSVTFQKDGDMIVINGKIDADKKEDDLEFLIIQEYSESGYDKEMISIFNESDSIEELCTLLDENGKNYLVIGNNLLKIDITEDFSDGKCNGAFEMGGETYQYEVTGNMKKYDIKIQS